MPTAKPKPKLKRQAKPAPELESYEVIAGLGKSMAQPQEYESEYMDEASTHKKPPSTHGRRKIRKKKRKKKRSRKIAPEILEVG